MNNKDFMKELEKNYLYFFCLGNFLFYSALQENQMNLC